MKPLQLLAAVQTVGALTATSLMFIGNPPENLAYYITIAVTWVGAIAFFVLSTYEK